MEEKKINKLEYICDEIMKNKDYPYFEIISNFSTVHITCIPEHADILLDKIRKLTDNHISLGHIQETETSLALKLIIIHEPR